MVDQIKFEVKFEDARQCKPNKKEIGDKWDEPLHIFFQGVININFKENMIGYTAGDKLTGTIDI